MNLKNQTNKQNNFTSKQLAVLVPVSVRREIDGGIVRTNPEDNKKTFVVFASKNKIAPSFKTNSYTKNIKIIKKVL